MKQKMSSSYWRQEACIENGVTLTGLMNWHGWRTPSNTLRQRSQPRNCSRHNRRVVVAWAISESEAADVSRMLQIHYRSRWGIGETSFWASNAERGAISPK